MRANESDVLPSASSAGVPTVSEQQQEHQEKTMNCQLESRATRDATWVVWSFEHDSWWASKRAGYVGSLLLAGLYTEAEAKEIERSANRDAGTRNEEARSLTQALIDERARWGRRGGMVIDVVEAALADAAPLPPGQYRDTAGALRYDGRITTHER